jgi:hypothetical protein
MEKQNADTDCAEGFNAKNSSSADLLIAPAHAARQTRWWKLMASQVRDTSPVAVLIATSMLTVA